MAQQLKTLLNRTYEVQTPEVCTVTNSAGNTILTAYPGSPVQFTGDGKDVTLSAEAAVLRLVEGKSLVVNGGNGGASATGEAVVELTSSSLQMQHASWFINAKQSSVSVQPAAWQNRVITCYLKTEVPVALSGVTWIYGQPTMVEGYIYVIALQQIGVTAVLANLAYTLPQ